MAKILILGGTTEARELAMVLAPEHTVTTSLAGRTQTPSSLAGDVRVGGFGGANGLKAYLREHTVDAVIDATHPFAAVISANAREACEATATPRLQWVRPAWVLPDAATVVRVPDLAEAARRLPEISKRALLTVGAASLDAFRPVHNVSMVARVIDAPLDPAPFEIIVARPPFDLNGERALLAQHAIDTVVTKDAGGAATAAKLQAAAEHGAALLIIERPPPEPGAHAATVEDAVDWIRTLSA